MAEKLGQEVKKVRSGFDDPGARLWKGSSRRSTVIPAQHSEVGTVFLPAPGTWKLRRQELS